MFSNDNEKRNFIKQNTKQREKGRTHYIQKIVTKMDFCHHWTTKMNQGHSRWPMATKIQFDHHNLCLGW
jgi:hypothetical protein